ncbi:LD-carboxypeptidase [Lactococcus cremoris]|uniref:LD-carboxypeptidase n=2 Tax=Lactococcus lactis subsp. cremoris TaxID=1359 RepID=UPI002208F3FE|nr:LD-carboxypeptidase [Lactococcus cremoris]UXV60308.1 LD-carboxypeptidase [Lactococcus cremoris]
MTKIFPKKLQKGDEIRVISPSSSLTRTGKFEDKLKAKARLEALGYQVTFGQHILENDLLESSSINSRLADFHAAFLDPNVKAILCTIGGFNSNELLPYIDWNIVKNSPKIFCGFSDITVLHQAIFAKTGLVTYYGPGYIAFLMDELQDFQTNSWQNAVAGQSSYSLNASDFYTSDAWYDPTQARHLLPAAWKIYNHGKASGEIIGGNLNTLMLVTGTSAQVKSNQPIAFLENAEGEDFYDWDRELAHFLQVYPDISALVIGRFPKEEGMTEEILHFILDKYPHLKTIPADAFANVSIEQIFSSPFQRSVRTLNPLAHSKNLEIQLISDLRERNVGHEIADFWPFAKRQWKDFDYKLADGESLREVQNRNISALEQILATSKNQKVAIGTHGTSLSTILNFYQPDFQFQDFQSLAGKMPYVIKMDFAENNYLTHQVIEIDYDNKKSY